MQYGVRFRLASTGSPAAEKLRLSLYDLLDEWGMAEDVSEIDGAGVFNLWVTVDAETPEGALRCTISRLAEAERDILARFGGPGDRVASIVGVELELTDTRTPSLIAAVS